ncbi:MAG TPA: carbohydrate ABC transporter permease [Fimbriimonadaceae bacterium]|nr:carbohydrate ABC transporter permease [Fimbriimonadaceae bacterium]
MIPQTEAARYERSAKQAARLGLTLKLLVFALLIGGAVSFMMPYWTMLVMAFKSDHEMVRTSVWAWPQEPTWENFQKVLTSPNVDFFLFFKNSLLVTLFSVVGVTGTSAAVAYAFARLRFAGRDRLFLLLLSTMMLPAIVTLIPTFVMFANLGWVNTFLPLTVPAFFGGGAFNIFLLRQFFLTLPRELDEAALLDGASHWTIFSRVVLPLSKPALITVALFCFIGTWRDFFGPLIYLNDPDKQTLELGLQTFRALNDEKWTLIMSGAVLISLPLVVIFFVGQRFFVKGIAMTGGK